MQLRLKSKIDKRAIISRLVIKAILFVTIFIIAIFLIDKIEMPVPNKFIKQEISNDKLTTLK
jgi:hypothetical protein|tara:strand:- start:1056 stop:1241 length:186 start_codon:yes stop_codon:yes gene_type:complete